MRKAIYAGVGLGVVAVVFLIGRLVYKAREAAARSQ